MRLRSAKQVRGIRFIRVRRLGSGSRCPNPSPNPNQSAYLPGPRSRALVTDFAVVASILTWTVIDHFALPEVKTERRTLLLPNLSPISPYISPASPLHLPQISPASPQVKTERLAAPDTFAPTYTCCTAACNTHWPEQCTDVAEAAGRRPWLVCYCHP